MREITAPMALKTIAQALCVGLIALLSATPSWAQTDKWTGVGADADWYTPGNWPTPWYPGQNGIVDGEALLQDEAVATLLDVGDMAWGSLSITSGGHLSALFSTIGRDQNAHGTVTLSGPGSRLELYSNAFGDVGTLTVARYGTGEIFVNDGARLTTYRLHLALGSSGQASMNVTGQETLVSAYELVVANEGKAELTIDAGSRVKVAANQWGIEPPTILGRAAGSEAIVNLSNGGILESSGATGGRHNIVAASYGEATINIGGAAGGPAVSAGRLVAADLLLAEHAGSQGSLIFNHTDSGYIFDTALSSGSGYALLRHLSGETILTGNSSGFGGITSVEGGTLRVNGSLGNNLGQVDVSKSGTLSGNGTIRGDVTIHAGGTLAPDNSPNYLLVDGDVILASGSRYVTSIRQGDRSDMTVASGKVQIEDGATAHVAATGSWEPNHYYTLLSGSAGLTGRFTAITSDYAFVLPRLSYSSQSVEFSLAPNGVGFDDVAHTANQRAVAAVLADQGYLGPFHSDLMMLSSADARAAYDSMSGEIHASGQHLATQKMLAFQSALGSGRPVASSPQEAAPLAYDHSLPGGTAGLRAIESLEAGGLPPTHATWLTPIGAQGFVAGDGNAARLDWSAAGVALGYEGALNLSAATARYGFGLAYLDGSATVVQRSSELDSEGVFAGVYSSWSDGPLSLKGNAAYGLDHVSTLRDVALGPSTGEATTDYWSHSFGLGLEASYAYALTDDLAIAPVARLDAGLSSHGTGIETGAGLLDAAIGSSALWRLDTGLGFKVDYAMPLSTGDIATLRGQALWQHAAGDTAPEQDIALVVDGSDFVVMGPQASRDSIILGAGLDFNSGPASQLSFDYVGQFAGDLVSHKGTASLKLAF